MTGEQRGPVLWDSSAILAFMDKSDPHHAVADDTARRLSTRCPPFITNYVRTEAHALILSKMGRSIARPWLLESPLSLWRATVEEEALARGIVADHKDKDWSLCDCISFAVIETRKALGAFTFDIDFKQRGRFKIFGLK
jgi:predicted nucleic acid-binding protein